VELFARVNVQLVLKEGLCPVREVDPVTVYPGIRGDLAKIAHAGYACELADMLLPEGLPHPRLFRLLTAYLERLDEAQATESDRRFFEINLLNILGYRPPLDTCTRCGVELGGEGGKLAGDGSVLCCGCGRGGKTISHDTLTLLDRALRTGRFGQILFTSGDAGALLDAAIATLAPRPIRSLSFLRELAGD
jgi:DNA repair protein RecO (recombination protein O)